MSIKNEAKRYIDKILNPNWYSILNDVDTINLQYNEDAIYKAVTSSRFRKTRIMPETEKDIRDKIHRCVVSNSPINFSIPFGAYKSWQFNLNFAPDWAEVFNLSFLMRYGAQIVAIYPPGVNFHYTYQSGIMYLISNIQKNDIELYTKVFNKLLDFFNSFNNKIRFSLVDIKSFYDTEEDYYIDFLDKFRDNLIFWDSKYDINTRNRHFSSAIHNLYPFGKINISEESEYIKNKYYYYSALMTDAVDCLSHRRTFNKDGDNIQLVCVKGPSKCINIGACETSTVHFWVGYGLLKMNKGVIKPYIYTFSSLSKLSHDELVKIRIKNLLSDMHPNYEKVPLII